MPAPGRGHLTARVGPFEDVKEDAELERAHGGLPVHSLPVSQARVTNPSQWAGGCTEVLQNAPDAQASDTAPCQPNSVLFTL
jgi:hypothetical protein